MKIQKLQIKKLQKGYTLLFAVITATLVLGVAVFILSVSKKQYALAVVARESTYAVYAADSGIECMTLVSATTTANFDIVCDGQTYNVLTTDFDSVSDPQFVNGSAKRLHLPKIITLDNSRCALIMIATGNDISDPSSLKTVIESRGYNQCDANGPVASTRTVERALRLTLQ